jgi:hypothetical protein
LSVSSKGGASFLQIDNVRNYILEEALLVTISGGGIQAASSRHPSNGRSEAIPPRSDASAIDPSLLGGALQSYLGPFERAWYAKSRRWLRYTAASLPGPARPARKMWKGSVAQPEGCALIRREVA